MSDWIAIANVDDVPSGTAVECVAGDRVVALFRVDETFYALDGVCPHQGGPLGKGSLNDVIITCPWHGWQFDVRTGQSQLSASVCQPSMPVRVDGDRVLVDIAEGRGKPESKDELS